ncbi:MAG: heme NO-binding domain-containing protein [Deltaproteobacteria bacterium]|nr:heme NO-binding domain-containing protein [Deltaproteobacteria bacterium]
MYGLVNKAVETMVRGSFGDETWHRIRSAAGREDEPFLSMRTYPDVVTWNLVAAASQELQMEPDAVLEAFGRYWIRYSAQEGYGQMLSLFGADLRTFLMNLDEMHARIGLSFPDLHPPSFSVSEQGPGTVHLHYKSHREGLGAFVVGLVLGLADRFSEQVDISLLESKGQGSADDLFLVRWSAST